MALLYAGQVVLAALLLMEGYAYFNAPAAVWAVVSAAMVVQPVVEQSLVASAIRIAANGVGGICGIVVGHMLGDGMWEILLALVVCVFICERLRLDLGLRTACVSVVVIMMRSEGRVISTSTQRFFAVVVGCVTALLVQMLAEALRKRLGWTGPPQLAPAAASSAQPASAANK